MDFTKMSWENTLAWHQIRYYIEYWNHLSDCIIFKRPSIWSAWWKWLIHSLGKMVEFSLIDNIVYLLMIPSSSNFIIMRSKPTKSFYYPIQYLLARMEYCGQRILATKRIKSLSWMPWSSHILIFQHVSQSQSNKNDHVSLVLLTWVSPVIQMEMLHCQRKATATPWMLNMPLDLWYHGLNVNYRKENIYTNVLCIQMYLEIMYANAFGESDTAWYLLQGEKQPLLTKKYISKIIYP